MFLADLYERCEQVAELKQESPHRVGSSRQSPVHFGMNHSCRPVCGIGDPSLETTPPSDAPTCVQPAPACGEKESLTKLLNDARAAYAQATRELETCPSDKLNEAYELADNARFLYEIARDAFEEHLKDHGCY